MPELIYYTALCHRRRPARLRLIDAQRNPLRPWRAWKARRARTSTSYALATGRLLWRGATSPGPDLHAEFRWVRLDNGSYRGAWHHDDKAHWLALPLDPCTMSTDSVDRQTAHDLDPFIASQLASAPTCRNTWSCLLSHR
jgi:hypothetical protein